MNKANDMFGPQGDYPQLEEAIRLANARGIKGDDIFAELGGDDLVKAHLTLGEGIVVQFTAMSTTDAAWSNGVFTPTDDIGWDAWDAVTTGSLKGGSAGGDGGVATTPAEAVDAVSAFLVGGGFATVTQEGILQSAVERVTKTWTVTFEGDQRIAAAVEMGLKVMADTAFDMADADELGVNDRDFDLLAEVATVTVTDAEGTVLA